jgi:purine-nucleoside phosphorylase
VSPPSPVGVVAGSGIKLEALLDQVLWERPFSEFDGLAPLTVLGHTGRFVHGLSGDVPIIIQCGRIHLYEGAGLEAVTRPVDVLHQLGAQRIILTNAAGGLDPEMRPGELVAAERVVLWPCRRWASHPESLSVDWTMPRCDRTGIYAWMHGPTYETKAEIATLQAAGVMAVGMSVAPELHRARTLGIPVAVASCITNVCTTTERLLHTQVLETAHGSSSRIVDVLRRALPEFAATL